MEGHNMFSFCLPAPLPYTLYAPPFPYYSFSNHPLQTLHFIYNQYSSPLAWESQPHDPTPPTPSSTDSHSFSPLELLHPLVENTPNPAFCKTRYSNSRVGREEKGVGKEGGKGENEQKENRNVYSNILRNFFRKVNDS